MGTEQKSLNYVKTTARFMVIESIDVGKFIDIRMLDVILESRLPNQTIL